ncbi:uncharacterized protein LOC121244255 [Juglans microcarpa x Juglans regia]|uniref:uncharacterized protein LOC121244255 n=1 Tax=Juglans microcarpa x Juglans regia TaxID=2249226 RepID=UPI001B7EDECA|nr:uncharacterized protein LOC121244255 [Juglans microcarpa x Juglans regia]
MDIERTFDVSGCSEVQKVQYAGHMLQGEVGIWWETKQQLLARESGNLIALTWDRFKIEFANHFFPEMAKLQKVLEFTNLTQGNMAVDQYAARFMEMGRFAHHLISAERMQARKSQDGLQPRIQNQVACLWTENFQELVNVASIIEAEQWRLIAQAQGDRKSGFPYSPGGSMGKRKALVTPNKGKCMVVGNATLVTPPPCCRCKKRHGGKCRMAIGACFRCGQTDHMIRYCSQITLGGASMSSAKPKTAVKAKVYAITPGKIDLEADETADAGVITGSISNFALIHR